jgi:hypothetical protein
MGRGGHVAVPERIEGGVGAKTGKLASHTPLAREQLHFFYHHMGRDPANGIGAGGEAT